MSARRRATHVAVRLRPRVDEVARRYGASAKVAEIPPGPPVLATLTAEVYGPTPEARRAAAEVVRSVFDSVPGVVDVDWSLRAEHSELHLSAVPDAAAIAGLAPAEVAQAMTAVGGVPAGTLHDPRAADPVGIVVRFAAADRAGSEAVRNLRLPTRAGTLVPATAVAVLEERAAPQPIYRKDLKPVVYVTADVARELESPAYAMLAMEDRLAEGGDRDHLGRPGRAHRAGEPQLGRRVADHLRGVPRPRHRVRGGAGADLPAGGRLVPVLPDPAGHHGADPAHACRHPSGPLAQRRLLHRDLDDRDDRPRRDHRPQLDPAGGLHRAGPCPRRADLQRRWSRPARSGPDRSCSPRPPWWSAVR